MCQGFSLQVAIFKDKRCFRNHIHVALQAITKYHEETRVRCKNTHINYRTIQSTSCEGFIDVMFSCLHAKRKRLILERLLVLKCNQTLTALLYFSVTRPQMERKIACDIVRLSCRSQKCKGICQGAGSQLLLRGQQEPTRPKSR